MNFKSYLATNKRISENHITYFLRWVELYEKFIQSNDKLELFKFNSVNIFLNENISKYEDWQIKQLKESLLLYEYYLNNIVNKKYISDNEKSIIEKEEYNSLKQEMINIIRLQHKSYQTEKTYISWVERFFKFINYKKSNEIDETDVKNYLSYLSVERDVSVSTQKQALNAIVYFFRYILKKEVNGLNEIVKARKPKKLPLVLSMNEVLQIISNLKQPYKLMCEIIYSSGLRLTECLNLRIKDIDFERNCIIVRSGKGDKDRKTLFAETIKRTLKVHIEKTKKIYEKDFTDKVNGVELPYALGRKYPNASKEWAWFWLFPSYKLSIDPRSNIIRRHYIYPTSLQKAFKKALRNTDIVKNASIHTLRHSFATHLIEANYDIRTVQELLGHSDVKTTMIYTHVAQKNLLGVKSPLDME